MKISVRVSPNAKRSEVTEVEQDGVSLLRVRVDAPPRKGLANERLREILAEHFAVPKSAVRVVKGQRQKLKTVEIRRD
ncbi:MAG: DUF167 domain-containing protein [Terriglobia bacterium]